MTKELITGNRVGNRERVFASLVRSAGFTATWTSQQTSALRGQTSLQSREVAVRVPAVARHGADDNLILLTPPARIGESSIVKDLTALNILAADERDGVIGWDTRMHRFPLNCVRSKISPGPICSRRVPFIVVCAKGLAADKHLALHLASLKTATYGGNLH
jgi:hypothetical protein